MSSHSKVFIYHWYNDRPGHLWQPHVPLLFSIACLRHFCTDPVIVIDLSRHHNRWENYPVLLDFKVVAMASHLETTLERENFFEKRGGIPFHHRMCSKPWDIQRAALHTPQDQVVFCDADLFWIQPPEPFYGDWNYFNCSGNTGLFYYRQSSPTAHNVLDRWQAFTSLAYTDQRYAERLMQEASAVYLSDHLHDEILYNAMTANNPAGTCQIDAGENLSVGVTDGCLNWQEFPTRKIKALHLRDRTVDGKSKMSYALRILEINRVLRQGVFRNVAEAVKPDLALEQTLRPFV